jgi:hypothetical protein
MLSIAKIEVKSNSQFTHISLPNPGITASILPESIYREIMNEANQIQSNWNLHKRWSEGLVGNMEKQYQLKTSVSVLEPFLNQMCKSYADNWGYYKKDGDFTLDQLWINFQKKNEFNPVHHHNGTFSFVCWLKIPYKIEDELNAPHVKDSHAKVASTFQFVYSSIVGEMSVDTAFVSNDWERKIILFPAKLSHCVHPFSTSDDFRISISGNLL